MKLLVSFEMLIFLYNLEHKYNTKPSHEIMTLLSPSFLHNSKSKRVWMVQEKGTRDILIRDMFLPG